jgi:PIN domain nuclease of toxin-antitoxin system
LRLLLDTQVFLWWLADSPRLPAAARRTVSRADEVMVSTASLWEATVKIGLGKLEAEVDEIIGGIEASGFHELPIRAAHVATLAGMPLHHRDPFDRMLVAQALTEPLRLLTADRTLRKYSELVTVV